MVVNRYYCPSCANAAIPSFRKLRPGIKIEVDRYFDSRIKDLNVNNRVNDFRKKLISSRIAKDYELVGCSCIELIQLEKKYGKLPTSYKQIMQLLGKRAGKLVDRSEFDFYIDQISELNKEYQPIFQEELQEMNIDKKIFLICSRYGDYHNFIWANGASDSSVFIWEDDEDIEEIYSSIWDWAENWIVDAQEMMKIRNRTVYYSDYWKRNI